MGSRKKKNSAFRGYSIRRNHLGAWWIEKDGNFIGWAKSEADAKRIIRMLTNPPKGLPDLSLFGKGRSTDPLDLVAPSVTTAGRGIRKMTASRRAKKKKVGARRKRKNPSLKDLMGPIIGEQLLAVEYRGGDGKEAESLWRHDFKSFGAKVIGLRDGSVLLKRGKKPLWKVFD